MYVPIPKCATISLRRCFLDWRATDEYRNQPCPIPGFAVVRDPVSRWFAGAYEFTIWNGVELPEMFEQARAGKFIHDMHTIPQVDYLEGFDVELVRLDSANAYIKEKFNRSLGYHHQRTHRKTVPDLIPAILDFYAEDLVLYESAID